MTEAHRLKKAVIFIQTILSLVLSTMILYGVMEMLQLKIFENMKKYSTKVTN